MPDSSSTALPATAAPRKSPVCAVFTPYRGCQAHCSNFPAVGTAAGEAVRAVVTLVRAVGAAVSLSGSSASQRTPRRGQECTRVQIRSRLENLSPRRGRGKRGCPGCPDCPNVAPFAVWICAASPPIRCQTSSTRTSKPCPDLQIFRPSPLRINVLPPPSTSPSPHFPVLPLLCARNSSRLARPI